MRFISVIIRVAPPEISGTTKGMTMKFLPDVGVYKEARNQKRFLT